MRSHTFIQIHSRVPSLVGWPSRGSGSVRRPPINQVSDQADETDCRGGSDGSGRDANTPDVEPGLPWASGRVRKQPLNGHFFQDEHKHHPGQGRGQHYEQRREWVRSLYIELLTSSHGGSFLGGG